MGTTYHNKPIVTDGLIFCVDPANVLSYPRTGATATDIIGDTTGTLTGAGGSNNTPQWENVNAGVFNFDGTDDFIDYGDLDAFSFGNGTTDSPFSISAWFNAEALNGAQRFTIGKFDSGAEWLLQGRETFIQMTLYDSTSSSESLQTKYTATINTNVWTSVIFTYDGSSETTGCKMYINGSLVSTSNTKSSSYVAMGNKSSDLKIGARTNKEFFGKISSVQIYNSALSASEVTQNYNALKNRFI